MGPKQSDMPGNLRADELARFGTIVRLYDEFYWEPVLTLLAKLPWTLSILDGFEHG